MNTDLSKSFVGFFSSNPSDDLFKSCTYILDANVLLGLYRLDVKDRDSLLNILRAVAKAKKLWAPHQTMVEFFGMRGRVVLEQMEEFKHIERQLNAVRKRIKSGARIGGNKTLMKGFNNEVQPLFDKIISHLEKEKKKNPDYNKNDVIVPELENIYKDAVGRAFSRCEIEALIKEAEYRFQNNIPPGCGEDEKKEGIYSFSGIALPNKCGDYIIWEQVLNWCENNKGPVVFVTGEEKEDWIDSFGGGRRARPELVNEAFYRTGVEFSLVGADVFLRKASRFYGVKIGKVSIENISDAAYGGWKESIYQIISDLGGEAHLSDVYREVEARRDRLSPSWRSIVRRTIYNHSSDVDAYLGKEDLFEKVRDGVWRIRD
ncbi:PIN-like domain-containing protein [Halomonas sp. LR3S48]|uniref:PIN-like domain-containing protein n=1 Tax=Halomonas sp. LR3S48 TaxID=2982694 RepID=UPI0021E4FD53|nr:PIN-like domain-containing protein [Halomonas sp. LR3S48]UYG03537.1 PIN-like domain-containing protein [Halomonas sp. LR3S48]